MSFTNQYIAMCIQGGCFSFCFSASKGFIRFAKLWTSDSFKIIPPLFFGKNSVFWLLVQVYCFAIGSEKHFYVFFNYCFWYWENIA